MGLSSTILPPVPETWTTYEGVLKLTKKFYVGFSFNLSAVCIRGVSGVVPKYINKLEGDKIFETPFRIKPWRTTESRMDCGAVVLHSIVQVYLIKVHVYSWTLTHVSINTAMCKTYASFTMLRLTFGVSSISHINESCEIKRVLSWA